MASCASTSTTGSGCPAPVWPDKCALNWYAGAPTPACFDNWMDRITRQQELLGHDAGH